MAAGVTAREGREARLAAHLRAEGCKAFAWGSADCATFVCDWVLAETGADPMAPGRGRYRTALGARRILGSFRSGVRDALDAGLPRCEAARPGDVALVMAQGETGLVACLALVTGLGFAFRAPRGIAIGPALIEQAWSLG